MSLFLGKIHHWLYNKILWYERAEAEMIALAKSRGEDALPLVNKINIEFGAPTDGKPLDVVIDQSNIHGWLQQKIESAELRQAALITELLKQNSYYYAKILDIYTQQGSAAAKEYQGDTDSPEDIFNALNEYILEGMPCDRVNQLIKSSDDEYLWQTTTCLHGPYWTSVGGDILNFYDLRVSWIQAFVETIKDKFTYEKSENSMNKIFRRL